MHFHALGQETLTTTLTTTSKYGATTFGTHTRAETVLLFPGSFGSL